MHTEKLIEALQISQWSTVKRLLQEGADLHSIDTTLYTASIDKMLISDEVDFSLLKLWVTKSVEAGRTNELGWTPLHTAAFQCAEIEYLDPSQGTMVDRFGWTPFHVAAWRGHLKFVEYFIEAGFTPEVEDKQCGRTPLYMAVHDNQFAIVGALLAGGADVHHTSSTGNTYLMVAAGNNCMAITEVLILFGAKTDENSHDGRTALHEASVEGYVEIVEFLLKDMIGIDTQDINGYTSLHLAAQCGDIKTVQKLHQAGAKLDSIDKYNDMPLHAASAKGHIAVVRYLLSEGADTISPNSRGLKPFHEACQKGHVSIVNLFLSHFVNLNKVTQLEATTQLMTALYVAAYAGQLEVMQLLLVHGAFFNTPREELFLEMAKRGHYAILTWLLSQGVLINSTYCSADKFSDKPSGETALHIAAKKGDILLIDMLLAAGAYLEVQTQIGETPLHYAAQAGKAAAVEHVLTRGASVNVQDGFGNTALHRAVQCNCIRTIQLLLGAGASTNFQNKLGETVLHLYIKNVRCAKDFMAKGDILRVLLSASRCDNALQCKDMHGKTPLGQAVDSRNQAIIKIFLESDADFLVDEYAWKESQGDVAIKQLFANHQIRQAALRCAVFQQGIIQSATALSLLPQDIANSIYCLLYPFTATEAPTGWTQRGFSSGIAKRLFFFQDTYRVWNGSFRVLSTTPPAQTLNHWK